MAAASEGALHDGGGAGQTVDQGLGAMRDMDLDAALLECASARGALHRASGCLAAGLNATISPMSCMLPPWYCISALSSCFFLCCGDVLPDRTSAVHVGGTVSNCRSHTLLHERLCSCAQVMFTFELHIGTLFS